MNTIKVDKLEINNDKPFVLIAGLNVLKMRKQLNLLLLNVLNLHQNIIFLLSSKHLMTKLIDPQLIRTGVQGQNKV